MLKGWTHTYTHKSGTLLNLHTHTFFFSFFPSSFFSLRKGKQSHQKGNTSLEGREAITRLQRQQEEEGPATRVRNQEGKQLILLVRSWSWRAPSCLPSYLPVPPHVCYRPPRASPRRSGRQHFRESCNWMRNNQPAYYYWKMWTLSDPDVHLYCVSMSVYKLFKS